MSDRGLFVFPTHDEEWFHNKSKLLEVNKLFPVAKITAVGKGSHSKSGESEKAGGLLNTLYIIKQGFKSYAFSKSLCSIWSF